MGYSVVCIRAIAVFCARIFIDYRIPVCVAGTATNGNPYHMTRQLEDDEGSTLLLLEAVLTPPIQVFHPAAGGAISSLQVLLVDIFVHWIGLVVSICHVGSR